MDSLRRDLRATTLETASRNHRSAKGRSAGWTLHPGKVLDGDEVERVLTTARGREGLAVRDGFLAELALGSGLRVSEVAALVCGDLVLFEHPAVVVQCGKGQKARTVRVSTGLRGAAREFLEWKRVEGEAVDDCAPVFLNRRRGTSLTTRSLQNSWERTLRAARVRHVGIHSARHTYATHLLKASNGNLRLVQQQLGHASIATTQVYLGLFASDVEEAVEGLYRQTRKKEG